MLVALKERLKEALFSVLPVSLIVLVIAGTPLVALTGKEVLVFCVSSAALVVGIGFFNAGANAAMTPMGKHTGEGLSRSGKFGILLAVCFIMGVLITVAEPDLSVLAGQVSAVIPETRLVLTVGVGVGIFLLLAVLKILTARDLAPLLLFFYLVLFALGTMMSDRGKANFIALSFDSGGVTTGPVTVPFLMALGVGIARSVGGKRAGENSFGIVALCSIGPVIAVIMLALNVRENLFYQLPDYSMEANLAAFGQLSLSIVTEVVKSLILLLAFFFVLQATVLKLPRAKVLQIINGTGQTFIGLVIFLIAVTVGFMPIGFKLGAQLAARSRPLLIAFSFLIGMVVVLAEPAVQVLNRQVEEVTSGGVTRRQMMIALSLGVGLSIMLSVYRILSGFSLLYYLIPGYVISLGLSFFVPPLYTAIAFDSGGVASGPLTSSFILPFAVGVCACAQGENEVLQLAFGIVAMVAMTPLITIQALGFKAVALRLLRERRAMKRILSADDAEIIYFR